MSELNPAARQAKFRHMCLECGLDKFIVIGWAGQEPVVFRQQQGEADRRLIDSLLRDEHDKLDPIVVDDEEWHDSD